MRAIALVVLHVLAAPIAVTALAAASAARPEPQATDPVMQILRDSAAPTGDVQSTRTNGPAYRRRNVDTGGRAGNGRFKPAHISSVYPSIHGTPVPESTSSSATTSSTVISSTVTSSTISNSTFATCSTTTTITVIPTDIVPQPVCGEERPIRLCCMGVAPWNTNSGIWGDICGYFPPSPMEIVGARCFPSNKICPGGTIGTCCAGTWPSTCALGTDCTPRAP